MTFLAPCLLAAAFTTGSATFLPPADQSGSSSSSSSQGSSSSSTTTARGGGAQPHHLGLGATFSLTYRGGGVSVRYFFLPRVGVDTRVLLASRPNNTGSSQGFSVAVAPAVIVMLTPPNTKSNIDVRPYVGFGISYTHTRADTQLNLPSASAAGQEVFGGVEMQFRDAQSFALSVEVEYFHQGRVLATTTAPKGATLIVGVHLYR